MIVLLKCRNCGCEEIYVDKRGQYPETYWEAYCADCHRIQTIPEAIAKAVIQG